MQLARYFSLRRIGIAMLLAVTATTPLAAQSGIALVDLSTVMRGNERLHQTIEQLKTDVLAFHDETISERRRLEFRRDEMQRWPTSSRLHHQERAALERQTRALQAKVEAERQQLLSREEKAYADAYARTMRHLEQHCQQRGLPHVARYGAAANSRVAGGASGPLVLGQNADLTGPLSSSLNTESRSRTLLGIPKDRLSTPARYLSTISEGALKSAATARAAWALDQVVFPPAS